MNCFYSINSFLISSIKKESLLGTKDQLIYKKKIIFRQHKIIARFQCPITSSFSLYRAHIQTTTTLIFYSRKLLPSPGISIISSLMVSRTIRVLPYSFEAFLPLLSGSSCGIQIFCTNRCAKGTNKKTNKVNHIFDPN